MAAPATFIIPTIDKTLFDTEFKEFQQMFKSVYSHDAELKEFGEQFLQTIRLRSDRTFSFRLTFTESAMSIYLESQRLREEETDFKVRLPEIEESLYASLQFWESIARLAGIPLIQFQYKWKEFFMKISPIHDMFTSRGFSKLSVTRAEMLGRTDLISSQRILYTKVLDPEQAPMYLLPSDDLDAVVEKVREHDSLFDYRADSELCYSCHYLGHEFILQYVYGEDQLFLIDPDSEFRLAYTDALLMENPLCDLLTKLEQIRRIPNLYNPDPYHAHRQLAHFPDHLADAAIAYFLQRSSFMEMERYFASRQLQSFPQHLCYKGLFCTRIDDVYFLYTDASAANGAKVHIFPTLDGVKQHLRQTFEQDLLQLGDDIENADAPRGALSFNLNLPF